MKTKQLWRFIGIILILSLIVGIMIHFNTIITALGLTSEEGEIAEKARGLSSAFSEVLVSSVVAFFTFMANYYIIRPFDSSIQLTTKKIVSAILITIVAVTVLSDSFFAVKHLIDNQPLFRKFNLIYSIRDLFTGIIVIAGMSFIKTVYDKQYVKIEIEMLKNEKLLSQYESLKNQISPHFMFNSLTALRELIDQNAADAKLYISHLSHVLRYTLTSIESQSKPLYEELEVAESYIHLVKIRFGTSLKVETKIDDRFKNHRLPPLAIQTLLENAIKHNEISKKNPFTIRIETGSDETVSITNVIRERVTKEFSSGLGLSNLSKQYQYLAGTDISISNINNEFRVELPLLNPSSNESLNS
jgi:sensor histidine kinase YesM